MSPTRRGVRRRLLACVVCLGVASVRTAVAQEPAAPLPIAIEWPADGAYLKVPSAAVRVRAGDEVLSVSVNGVTAARDPRGLFVAEPVALPEGAVTLMARAVSRDGRTWTTSVRVTADRTPPRIAITDQGLALTSGTALKGRLRPLVTAEDRSPVNVRATLNGEPFTSGSEIAADGSYTLEVEASDRAGNVSRKTVFFRIDSRPPALSRLTPLDGTALRGDRVGVSGECEDAISVTVGGVAASVYGGRFVARDVPLTAGRNRLAVLAKDAAGNETRETLELFRDEVSPKLVVSSPSPGFLTREPSVVVRGTAEDPNLAEVSVNNVPAALSGAAFEREVRLSEGPNRLVVLARDTAGNRTEATLDVIRDSTPPVLSISSPASGSVLGSSQTAIVGDVSDASLESITVNSIPAEIINRRFRATVTLTPGVNTITVKAADRAGNSSTVSVSVTQDDDAPFLSLDQVPAAALRTTSLELGGSLAEPVAKVTVNGKDAEVSGSRFRTVGLKLHEGVNALSVTGTGSSGRTAVANALVSVDTIAPELVAANPADGATDLSIAAVVRLSFSEAIDPSSVKSGSVRIRTETGSDPVPVSVFVSGKEVSLLPLAVLADHTAFRLEVSDAVTDLAGNRLRKPWTTGFTTGGAAAPARPQLESLPEAVCGRAVTLSGRTDPGARVRIEGGETPETAVARSDGFFSATVALRPESANALRLQAFDAQGRASEPLEVALRADCTRPRVERVTYQDGKLEVLFSEPMNPQSLARDGAIRLTAFAESPRSTQRLRIEQGNRAAVFEDPEGVLASGTTVVVDPSVTDLAGNPLSAVGVTSLAAITPLLAGTTGGLSGQVFDDRIGRPLPGVSVTVVAVNGAAPTPPAPTTTTDGEGRYSLVVPVGDIAVRAALDAYTATTRVSTVVGDQSSAVFDIRLTPETVATAKADGSADITDRELRLTLPAASAASASSIRVASLSPQGLPFLPPLGWSPAASLSFELGPVTAQPSSVTTLPSPAAATLSNVYGYPTGSTLLLARYDAATRKYLSAGTASIGSGATTIQASIPSTGSWVVLVPDPAPNAPPQPSTGQPVNGVATPGTDPIASATVISVPQDVLPTQSADITATLTLSAPAPSGYPVQVLVSETLTLINNQQMQVPSFLENLTLLRDGTGRTIVPFRVRPSATAAQVALSVGYENLVVKRYTFDLRRGNLVGSGGGTITGPLGFTLVIPANALTQTVPVNLTQVSGAAELPIAIPAGYVYRAAVRLDLAGQTLTAPATLRWASTTDPTGSGLVWVEAATLNAVSRARFAGPGRYDATNHWAETTPAAVHNLPVSGVVRSGLYVLLSATQPLAYVKGRVLDVDGITPVASAIVTGDANSIVAVSDGLGNWSLPVPTTGTTVRAARIDTGNIGQVTVPTQAAGAVATADVRLSVTAPYVLSIAPATNTLLPLDLPVVFTLSEPLNPATVSDASISAISGSASIPGTVRLSASGAQVTFTPKGSWPGKSSVTLTLSSTVMDWHGYRLVDRVTKATSNYTATYVTVDPTPPSDINPLLISMSLPSGTPPTVTIAGLPGAACAGCTVVAVNDTTTVTASTTALSNGSFTLTLAATTTDRVYIVIRRPSGAELYVNPGPYRVDGGRVVYVSDRAADYITRDGIRVTLDDSSFSGPVTLKVKPIAQASLPAPLPEGAHFIGAIEFDPGDAVSSKPIDLAVPAPPGVTGGQFLVARAVQVLGETRWMVIDTARYDNGAITTRPAPGTVGARGFLTIRAAQAAARCPQLSSAQPKGILDRVTRKSNLMIMNLDLLLGFIAEDIVLENVLNGALGVTMAAPFTVMQSMLPFVWVPKEAKQQCYFAMPVPLNVPFAILARDLTTGLTMFQRSFSPVTDPDNVTVAPPGTPTVIPAPRLLYATPFLAQTFVPAATPTDSSADRRQLLPGIQYSFVISNGIGTVNLYGANGSVEKCQPTARCSRLLDLSLTNNAQKTEATGAALPDGSFGPLSLAAKPGEDLTFLAGTASLAPTAVLHLMFSAEVDRDALKSSLSLKDGATDIDFILVSDSKPKTISRGFTISSLVPFQRDHVIILTIADLGSADPNRVPKTLTIKMSSPRADVIGTRPVKDVNSLYLKGGLLFEVTGDAGNTTSPGAKLNLYDVTDPANVKPCGTPVSLDAFARGVMMDDYDRVLVAMGGGGTNGRVQVFRISPYAGPGDCGGRRILPEGTNAGDSDRSWTETTIRTGAGDLGVLPEGFPRKLQLLSRESRQTIVLDVDRSLPRFVTALQETDLLPAGQPDNLQDPDAPLRVIGQIPPNPGQAAQPSPWNQPVTVINRTTGASWTAYGDSSGNFTIDMKASSGDRLEFRSNASEVAVVGTESFGLQGVEVNKTMHLFGQDCRNGAPPNDVCEIGKRLRFSLGNLNPPLCRSYDPQPLCWDAFPTLERLNDIALLPKPELPSAQGLPAPGDPSEPTILAAVSRFGLATFSLIGDAEDIFINQLGPGIPLTTFDQPPIFPSLWAVAASRGWPVKRVSGPAQGLPQDERKYCSDTRWRDYRPTLAFAASSEGIFVADVTNARGAERNDPAPPSSPYGQPAVVGLFKMASAPSTLALDSARGLLYSGGPDGIAVYDMSDPCTVDNLGLNPGRVAEPNDLRRLAFIPLTNENVSTQFALDADTGILFGAGDPTSGGDGQAFTLALQPPPLRFVADTDRDGTFELVSRGCPLGVVNPEKNSAEPYCPDVVRVLANVFGKAGQGIAVELSSASAGGIGLPDPPPTGFPRTKTYVTLARQSDDPANPGYNRYLSPPIVLIADPRARKDYTRAPEEDDATVPADFSDYACHNCKVRDGYLGELSQWALDTEGQSRTATAKKAIEHWSGEKLVARLAWDAQAEADLKSAASYLQEFDLRAVKAEIPTTRGDLTPSLRQPPTQNPSLLATEAGLEVATHSGGVQTSWTDLSIKGRNLDFVLSRYYVSDVLHSGPFGRNMDSPLFARVRDLPSRDVDFYPGNGTRHTFRYIDDPNAGDPHFQAPAGVFLDLYRRTDRTFILIYPDQTKLYFDEAGRLTKLLDPQTTKEDDSDGNQMRFLYDGAGRLSSVLDPTMREVRFRYNDDTASPGVRGLISKVTDFDGREVSYTYDADGRLTKAEGPDPASSASSKPSTTLVWSTASGSDLKQKLYHGGELTSLKDGENRQVFLAAYRAAQPASLDNVTLSGGKWQLEYAGSVTTVTDPNSNSRTLAHESSGQLRSVMEPDGATTAFMHDSEGRLTNLIRPLGDALTYDYSAAIGTSRLSLGNVTSVRESPRSGFSDPARVTTISYGAPGPTSPNLPTAISSSAGTIFVGRDNRGNATSVLLPDGSTHEYTFDEHGLMTSATTGGLTETLTYFDTSAGEKEGYLKSRSGGTSSATYDVDKRGNVTSSADSDGRSVSYQINKLDQLEQRSEGGSFTRTRYNAVGQFLSQDASAGTDAQGNQLYLHTTFVLDELDRLKGRTVDDGTSITTASFTYDPAGNLRTASRGGAPNMSFGYDSRNQVTSMTVGSATQFYAYDANGTRTRAVSPRGNTTTYLIDGFGRRFGSIDPMQVRTVEILDVAGRSRETRVTQTVGPSDVLYRWTTRELDALGRVAKEIRKLFTDPIALPANGAMPTLGVTDVVTERTFDSAGHLLTLKDPLGRVRSHEYDTQGRLRKTTDPLGDTIEYEYDGSGNITRTTLTEIPPTGSPRVAVVMYTYDSQNRPMKVTDPLGQETKYEYDQMGNRTKTTDAEGHVITASYDRQGHKKAETDANGGVTSYEYDSAGRLTALVDAQQNRTTFRYNTDGRVVEETRADGKKWTYDYDAEGNRITETDPNGTVCQTSFDPLNRPVDRAITRGAGVLGPTRITQTLDPLGRIVSSTTSGDSVDVVEAFAFDSLDRLLREEQRIGSGPNRVVSKGYDPAGNVNALTYPSPLSLTYDIDARNRIKVIRQGGAWIASYRDVGVRPFDKALANGIVQTFGLDAARRLTSIVSATSTATVSDVSYTLSPIGNKRAITRADLGKRATYQLNANSWITQEALGIPVSGGTPERQTDYGIDKVLNYLQIQERVNGNVSATKPTTVNSRNQYSTFAGSALAYDANGNLTSMSGTTLQYDSANRLKKATLPGGTVVENIFDASGRKVREAVTVSGTTTPRDYVFDNARVIEEYAGSKLAVRYVGGRRVDEIIRAELDTNGDGSVETVVVPLQDELGNVERLTGPAGQTLERYDYQGYGKLRIFDPAGGSRSLSSYGWRRLFQGRELVPTLGGYDFRARTLWPDLARFGQEDPARTSPRLSTYESLLGEWHRFTDPSGLYEEDVHHYLTTYLAEKAGFPPGRVAGIDEKTGEPRNSAAEGGLADEIGWEDQQLDMDGRVASFLTWTNGYYHFVPVGELDVRFEEIISTWLRPHPDSTYPFRLLGEYFHALQDSYSHQTHPRERDPESAYGTFLGHGLAGHYPDWTFERPILGMVMALDTYEKLDTVAQAYPTKARLLPKTPLHKVNNEVIDFMVFRPACFFNEKWALFIKVLAVGDYAEKVRILDKKFFDQYYQEADGRKRLLKAGGRKPAPYVPSHWQEAGSYQGPLPW